MAIDAVSVAAKLKRIRESYLKQVPAQMQAIRAAFEAIAAHPAKGPELEALHRAIHTMRGASASFGVPKLAEAAAVAEHLAKEALQSESISRYFSPQMTTHLAAMEREAAVAGGEQATDFQALELVDVAERPEGEQQKVVYLCQHDSFQRMSLSTQIGCFGFQVMAYGDLDQLYHAVKNSVPDAIVTDMMFPGQPTGGPKVVAMIQSERATPIPTVFLSSQNDFSTRLAAVRAGSSAYFLKPVNSSDLCATLTALTTVAKPEPYRVMIVDDDRHLLEMHSAILQGVGMVTLELDDPLQVMSHLGEFQPDLILTDMHMPGCDGDELAKTIRQSDPTFNVPIVFLSSESDADKQFLALRMGGDEFLHKPIKPEHLITAVAVRAERMKIVRSLMVRDAMTGLFNHSAINERLNALIEQKRANGGELCYAMIDIDKFKSVNDSHGHPTGDRVLGSLARFLTHRLGKADLVGRLGGDEFVVLLPDCDLAAANALMDKLRESFAGIRFPAAAESFNTTFSCGIAALSRHEDGERLLKAADLALHQAKEGGRNRVMTAGA